MESKGNLQEVVWEAVVIRANGDIEQRGVVSYWNRNPLKRLAWRLGWRPSV